MGKPSGTVDRIARAVLYEGYVLYPYRASAIKNRRRWTFGGVFPRDFANAHGGAEPCRLGMESLVEGDPSGRIRLRLRFLHPVHRQAGVVPGPPKDLEEARHAAYRPVPAVRAGDREFPTWQEAVERDLPVADLTLGELASGPRELPFAAEGGRSREPLEDADGTFPGILERFQASLMGTVSMAAHPLTEGSYHLRVAVTNETPLPGADTLDRDAAAPYGLMAAHLLLEGEEVRFLSLTDPPPAYREAAAACVNEGVWPVLVGDPGKVPSLLASPIILPDYPKVAPESPGNLFDGTEIDEMLSLRILTLTDGEKREMAQVDEQARRLLERTEALGPEGLRALHGTLRGAGEAGETAPRRFERGQRVRLRPRPRGDAMDVVLRGKVGIVETTELDYEDRAHVSVTLEADPGRDLGREGLPGHRFFLDPDELEPLDGGEQP
ncbi:MAG TPA: hypothetical protein VKA48_12915 [Gammaproteobacteria bacterium]|nr:hypothetical protein [Gammaproteobacteria bacterium]